MMQWEVKTPRLSLVAITASQSATERTLAPWTLGIITGATWNRVHAPCWWFALPSGGCLCVRAPT